MNFEYFLYQYLLKHQKAEITDFGVFLLIRESAKIDAENSVIIPPKESITFELDPSIQNTDFPEFVAVQSQSDLSEVDQNLKAEVSGWLSQLKSGKSLQLRNIGEFKMDDAQKVVKVSDHEDFGFEAINLNQLKSKKAEPQSTETYSLSKSVIWTFVAVIAVGSAILFGFKNPDLIFGKSSKIPSRPSVKKAQPKRAVIITKQDSLKSDSIKPTINAKIKKTGR